MYIRSMANQTHAKTEAFSRSFDKKNNIDHIHEENQKYTIYLNYNEYRYIPTNYDTAEP
jgi:hypothetical protein